MIPHLLVPLAQQLEILTTALHSGASILGMPWESRKVSPE